MLRCQLHLAILVPLLLSWGTQGLDVPAPRLDTPEARQAAVEASLLPRTWVEGHALEMTERMRVLGVPGVSVAVIHEGKIDWAAGYGVRDVISGAPVTSETLFQAASISKSISAMATLRLAQEGRFDLDAPIQSILTSYELPETEFKGEVTPRRILNHTAGLSVDGFNGYRTGERIPTAAEVVAGLGNSDPVLRIENVGERMRYSGGGSTLLQVALMDLTGQDFASIVSDAVLEPLGMTRSTYAQPLPAQAWPDHSAGHDSGGRRLSGEVHIYPEQFPAGLWTTPTDIARFALEVQQVAAKNDGQVLSAESGQAMLTPVFGRAGLGLFISEDGGERWFQHSGSNMGFKCDFRASFSGGQGVVVMTNGDAGIEICRDVIRAVAKVYGWTGVIGEPLEEVQHTPAQLERYAGRYELEPDEVVFITSEEGQLMVQQLPYPRLPLVPVGDHQFLIYGTDFYVDFQCDRADDPASLSMSMQPDQHASRMASDAYWPVQDLLRGDARDAVAYYQDAHEATADNPVVDCDRLIGLATGLVTSGRPEAALLLAQTVTELYESDAGAWELLGRVYASLGQREPSVAAYRSCLERIPEDASIDASRREWLKTEVEARLR